MFRASLMRNPVSPYVVGDKIRDIVDSGTWQLPHPVGPDAAGFLAWRGSMTDEEWGDGGGQSDDAWLASVSQTFGLDVKL